MSELIGRNLGPYRIIEQIGKGGMATVFKAYQASVDRYVAVKVLPAHFMQDPTFIERFDREARTIAKLEHPHILPVHDYGKADDGTTYIAMRYVEAGTLADMLQSSVLFLEDAYNLFIQIAEALAYAHGQGVVHRDMKPSNVLVDMNNQAFLTDFGLAKIMEGDSNLTGSMILGTPTYMAPEQGEGQPADERSDIYALGVILYEMTTGRPPFQAETPMAVMLKHMTEPLPLPREINPELPEPIERVILKGLAKEPDDRYQSVSELLAALKVAMRAVTSTAPTRQVEAAPAVEPSTTKPAGKRPAWLWPVVGGAVLLLCICAALAIFRGRAQRGEPTAEEAVILPQNADKASPPTELPPPPTPVQAVEAELEVEGLPPGWTHFSSTKNVVNALAIQDDLVWLGTEGGLVAWNRHDGSYKKYTAQDGLAYHSITALEVMEDGTLWVGTSGGGALHFDGDTWQTFTDEDGLSSNDVVDFLTLSDGTLLAATAYSPQIVSFFENGRWHAFDLPPLPVEEVNPTVLLQDENDALVVGLDDGGLLYLDGDNWQRLTADNGLPSEVILDMAFVEDGDLLLATEAVGGAGLYDGQTFTPIPELTDTAATALYAAPDGTVWVGTYGEGLWRFDDAGGTHFDERQGLPLELINAIAQDEDGALWLAVENVGLVRFDDGRTEMLTVDGEPPFNAARQILELEDGRIGFVGQWGSDIIALYDPDSDTWDSLEAPGEAQAVAIDAEGNTWFGTNDGLWRISESGARQRFSTDDGLPGDNVLRLALDQEEGLWIGTDAGLAYHGPEDEADVWHDVTDDIPGPYIEALYADEDGNIWIGTQSDDGHQAGIALADDGEIRDVWLASDTFSDEVGGFNTFVSDDQGRLWAGTWGDGLWRLDDMEAGQWRHFDAAGGAPESDILSAALQRDGSVWFGTSYDGLWRFDEGEGWQQLQIEEGLPGQAVFAMQTASDGSLWLSTESGIARFVEP